MESAQLKHQKTNEALAGRPQKARRPDTSFTSWPLILNNSQPAMRLGHAFQPTPTLARHALQAKLTISTPGDQYEQEADRVAEQVMRMPDTTLHVQRKCGCGGSTASGESCEECAGQTLGLQRRAIPQQSSSDAIAPPIVHDVLGSSGRQLDAATRAAMEPRFGHDFSHVRVHTDELAAASARAVGAQAYTVGNHLVFGAGQFSPATNTGRTLIAHELTHVMQQSGQVGRSLQRQGTNVGGPLDLQLDVCVTVAGRQVCGSDAAKLCSKVKVPGCGAVCKVFDCSKPKEPTTKCPPKWRAAGARGFEGQCCKGSESDRAENCCPPERISDFEDRCCGPGEVVFGDRCKKASDVPSGPIGLHCFPPAKPSPLNDKCCFPPEVPKGMGCGLPDVKPAPPQPVVTQTLEIFFKRDRPRVDGSGETVSATTTPAGRANFEALAPILKKDPTLKVQLVGRASPEADEAYNMELGGRRARLIATALKDAGVLESQIADPPESDLRSECQPISPGLHTCGEAGASGETDRQVLARVFGAAAP